MKDKMYSLLLESAKELERKLTTYRRDFHTYPEMGWCEIRTASLIARRLTELGWKVLLGRDVCDENTRMGVPLQDDLDREYQRAMEQGADPEFAPMLKDGFTGVIGILDCGEGPTIAMRFDIDALGVFENEKPEHRPVAERYCSVNSGIMHACGHDGHASIGLGVAEVLMTHRDEFRGKVKLIFQPAEEGVRGAKSIVAKGHLDNVDYLLCTHMSPNTPGGAGLFGATYGGTLATVKLDVSFRGKAAHAGLSPNEGNNAMLAAATAVLNLQAIPRHQSGETRINVGTLHAGTNRNVICERAKMELEVRGGTTEACEYLEEYARRIIAGAAAMHQCDYDISIAGAAPSLLSTPQLMERMKKVCEEYLNLPVEPFGKGSGASEDVSYMANRVVENGGQSLFFTSRSACAGPPHNENFDFQESVFPYSVAVFCSLCFDIMTGNPSQA